MEATENMTAVALVLALVPHQKFPTDFKDFPMEEPFSKWKWPCPLKDEIPGLPDSLIFIDKDVLIKAIRAQFHRAA